MWAKMMGFAVISFPILVAAFPNSGLACQRAPNLSPILDTLSSYLRTLVTFLLVKEYKDHVGSADFPLKVAGAEYHHVLIMHLRVPGLGEVPGVHGRELHLHVMGVLWAPGDAVKVHQAVSARLTDFSCEILWE